MVNLRQIIRISFVWWVIKRIIIMLSQGNKKLQNENANFFISQLVIMFKIYVNNRVHFGRMKTKLLYLHIVQSG